MSDNDRVRDDRVRDLWRSFRNLYIALERELIHARARHDDEAAARIAAALDPLQQPRTPEAPKGV